MSTITSTRILIDVLGGNQKVAPDRLDPQRGQQLAQG